MQNDLPENEHPITPPPELGASLRNSAPHQYQDRLNPARELWLINLAYQAGADMELEATLAELKALHLPDGYAAKLRAARRPKPPSLKEQALKALTAIEGDFNTVGDRADTIRRALEALPDD
jgi:hypothetical protein